MIAMSEWIKLVVTMCALELHFLKEFWKRKFHAIQRIKIHPFNLPSLTELVCHIQYFDRFFKNAVSHLSDLFHGRKTASAVRVLGTDPEARVRFPALPEKKK
jgi:hypothetical protein